MNAAQIHLALNHLPLFLALAGGILLAIGLYKKNNRIQLTAFYVLVAGALFTLPVFFTGEGTEEMVEEAPGITESLIGRHETMAKIAFGIILVTGALSLGALFLKNKLLAFRTMSLIVLVGALGSFGAMAQTAHLGGQIRHTEIQNGAISGAEKENNNEKGEKQGEKEDD